MKIREIIEDDEPSPWTRFMDMHSGGGLKEAQQYIYIEAPEEEAKSVFYAIFGHNPERVTCTCCGQDYSIRQDVDLAQSTAFDRNCHYDNTEHKYVEREGDSPWAKRGGLTTLEDYLQRDDVRVIYAKDIPVGAREVHVPRSGYVWVDEDNDE